MKTRFQNASYNVGYKDLCEGLDEIASDVDGMIKGCALACRLDEEGRKAGEVNLSEIWTAMGWMVDRYGKEIGTIYEEYKSIPKTGAEYELEGDARRGRMRKSKKMV
jgi:hypothetical protein